MRQKTKQPIAALVLLTLAVSTILCFQSWWDAETEMEWKYSSSESRRELSSYDYEKLSQLLEANGIKPGTPEFEKSLHEHMRKHENQLLKDIARLNQSKTAQGRRALKRKLWQHGNANTMALEMQSKLITVIEETQEKNKTMINLNDPKEVLLQGSRGVEVKAADETEEEPNNVAGDYQPLAICDRPTDVGSTEDFASLQKYSNCSDITKDKPIILLGGLGSFGRTGNNLVEFLHAIQEARDTGTQVGIMYRSWVTKLLLEMWMAINSDDWQAQFERSFCVKIFQDIEDLKGWDVIHRNTKQLLCYMSGIPLDDYIASQKYTLRTLFRNYNSGEGHDIWGRQVNDMCSGINAIFGKERKSAMYSVIHSRSQEGAPGFRLLGRVAQKSRCDPVAALEMKPGYIRSILKPLGMLNHPIVFISDGQNPAVLERLLADPYIGPMIHVAPEDASWIGSDLTLAIMSNAFIGNPASTFAGFIAKSRLALGFGHNYLFRAKDENGEWGNVCGDHCIFDKKILRVMS